MPVRLMVYEMDSMKVMLLWLVGRQKCLCVIATGFHVAKVAMVEIACTMVDIACTKPVIYPVYVCLDQATHTRCEPKKQVVF